MVLSGQMLHHLYPQLLVFVSLSSFFFTSVPFSFSYFISIRPLLDNLITLSKIKLRLSKGCGPILGHSWASQLRKLLHCNQVSKENMTSLSNWTFFLRFVVSFKLGKGQLRKIKTEDDVSLTVKWNRWTLFSSEKN